LLDALLAGDAPVNTSDKRGATPLLMLLGVHVKPGAECDGTHLGALVPVLLDAGAEMTHADEHGATALHGTACSARPLKSHACWVMLIWRWNCRRAAAHRSMPRW